jgi:hypothetical protein
VDPVKTSALDLVRISQLHPQPAVARHLPAPHCAHFQFFQTHPNSLGKLEVWNFQICQLSPTDTRPFRFCRLKFQPGAYPNPQKLSNFSFFSSLLFLTNLVLPAKQSRWVPSSTSKSFRRRSSRMSCDSSSASAAGRYVEKKILPLSILPTRNAHTYERTYAFNCNQWMTMWTLLCFLSSIGALCLAPGSSWITKRRICEPSN